MTLQELRKFYARGLQSAQLKIVSLDEYEQLSLWQKWRSDKLVRPEYREAYERSVGWHKEALEAIDKAIAEHNHLEKLLKELGA